MLLSCSRDFDSDALVYIVDTGQLLSRETRAYQTTTSATAPISPHAQPDATIEPLLYHMLLPPYRRCCAGDSGYAFLPACRWLLDAVTQVPRARPALPSAPVERDGAPSLKGWAAARLAQHSWCPRLET